MTTWIVGGICWSSAWPRCSSPWHRPLSLWREGTHYSGTQGQSDSRVTTVYLPRLRDHSSLPDVAYLLTARWTGAWGYRKNRPKFSTPPGDRTRDLSFVSRVSYRCTTESHDSMDQKKVAILMCDLSKAFDDVSHEILLNRLIKRTIDKLWFNIYMKDGTQSARLSNILSNKQNVDYRVPQGSVLGPILFSI